MQVCDPVAAGCDVCFEDTIAFSQSMNVLAGLTPASTPYLWIVDKFGNQYRTQITVVLDGSFNILPVLYPEGMFNQYSGTYDIFLSSNLAGTTLVDMTFDSDQYKCLKLSVSC